MRLGKVEGVEFCQQPQSGWSVAQSRSGKIDFSSQLLGVEDKRA